MLLICAFQKALEPFNYCTTPSSKRVESQANILTRLELSNNTTYLSHYDLRNHFTCMVGQPSHVTIPWLRRTRPESGDSGFETLKMKAQLFLIR